MSSFIVDAQLPPSLARMLREEFFVDATHAQELALREARDATIVAYAAEHSATVISKDHDFIRFVEAGRVGALVLVTCGNVRNSRLREIFRGVWPLVLVALESGEAVVEVLDERSLSEFA